MQVGVPCILLFSVDAIYTSNNISCATLFPLVLSRGCPSRTKASRPSYSLEPGTFTTISRALQFGMPMATSIFPGAQAGMTSISSRCNHHRYQVLADHTHCAEVPYRPSVPTSNIIAVALSEGSCFLRLPAEIRCLVYRQLLVEPTTFEPMFCLCYKERHKYWKNQGTIDATILRTCRSVYEEGISILYSENIFQLVCRTHNTSSEFFNDAQTLLVPQYRPAGDLIKKAIAEFYFDAIEPEITLSTFETFLMLIYSYLQQLTIRIRSRYGAVAIDFVMQRDTHSIVSLEHLETISHSLNWDPNDPDERWWVATVDKYLSFCKVSPMMRNTFGIKGFVFYRNGEPVCKSLEHFLSAPPEAIP